MTRAQKPHVCGTRPPSPEDAGGGGNVQYPSGQKLALLFLTFSIALCGARARASAETKRSLTFCCRADNDLFRAVSRWRFHRFTNALSAAEDARTNTAVLILADGYPNSRTECDSRVLAEARAKGLRLYIEYPAEIEGLASDSPRNANWERIIVTSDLFGPRLRRLNLLMAHSCCFVPITTPVKADLSLARVAGYDKAVFGLPAKDVWPVLFSLPGRNVRIAATKLSSFVTGRYAPAAAWQIVWESILHDLGAPDEVRVVSPGIVTPAYGERERLPWKHEESAFDAAANWFASAHLLVSASENDFVRKSLATNGETIVSTNPASPEGDGSFGILEGYASAIQPDGNQPRRLPLRADCCSESAMVLALEASLHPKHSGRVPVAENLLDFVFFNSDMCAGPRADVKNPAYGLIGWGAWCPAWLVANYGDDNARTILATLVASSALRTRRYDERVMRAVLANFRTTGEFGFRGDRIDIPALQKNGWRTYYQGKPVNYSPHFESYLWACYLWAYRQTGFAPFLDRTRTAIEMTMGVYPDQWRWQDNLERAHMLLSLAWLVRVEDTPEHRGWLRRVASDLVRDQVKSGAIHERRGNMASGGHSRAPQRNEDYGTTETPLAQENGDPVSDQLYTTGFALLGLHEAAAATGEEGYHKAEDRLAEFLCRIQTRSKVMPYLSGTWFRAFDDKKWETWASSADVGWGAWSVEAGWGQAWIAATLALRERSVSAWDAIADRHAGAYFPKLKAAMLDERQMPR